MDLKKKVFQLRLPQRMKWMERAFSSNCCVLFSLCSVWYSSYSSSKLGSPCAEAEPALTWWQALLARGLSLECRGWRMVPPLPSRVCILTVLNVSMMGMGVDEETYFRKSARPDFQGQGKPCFSCRGVDKMTFQDHSQLRGGPDHGGWPCLLPQLRVFLVQSIERKQTVAAACAPCFWRLAWEAGMWGRRAWACQWQVGFLWNGCREVHPSLWTWPGQPPESSDVHSLGPDSVRKSRTVWHAHLGPRVASAGTQGAWKPARVSQPMAWTSVLRALWRLLWATGTNGCHHQRGQHPLPGSILLDSWPSTVWGM